jgi:hypothetical protein
LAISVIQDKLYNRVHDIVGHSALNTINDVAYHVGKLEMKVLHLSVQGGNILEATNPRFQCVLTVLVNLLIISVTYGY